MFILIDRVQNWTRGKKLLTLFIVSFAGYTGTLQAVGNVSSIFQQGALYNKTAVEITYSVCHWYIEIQGHILTQSQVSAATAGLCAGPLFWSPISQKIGRNGAILWATVLTLACTIWAACSTSPSDYESFVVSRLFGCLFGSCATTVGAGKSSSPAKSVPSLLLGLRSLLYMPGCLVLAG